MKKQTSLALVTAFGASLFLASCAATDPEYKAWKEKKKAEAAANPYGVPAADATAANPYGVPQTGGETGTYTPAAGGTAPYQNLPGVSSQAPAPADPGIPAAGGGASHTVVSGDSLWGLARKYNTSIEDIKAANGLTTDVIRTGQTLTIPAR